VLTDGHTTTDITGMKAHTIVAAFAAVTLGCRAEAQAVIPGGWIAVAPPTGEEEQRCANWARDEWSVALSEDSTHLLIRPAGRDTAVESVLTPTGRLISFDHGEFGGEVWWEPSSGPRQLVAKENLRRFVQTTTGIWGLAGLAHLTFNSGQLIKFEPTRTGWRAVRSASLGAAPRTFLRLGGDTLLVATFGPLLKVVPPKTVQIIYHSPAWEYTFPISLARDRAGTIYVGMRSGVARLTPAGNGYRETWLVQKTCPRRLPTDSLMTCRCVQ
jgi:hypothetical protein